MVRALRARARRISVRRAVGASRFSGLGSKKGLVEYTGSRKQGGFSEARRWRSVSPRLQGRCVDTGGLPCALEPGDRATRKAALAPEGPERGNLALPGLSRGPRACRLARRQARTLLRPEDLVHPQPDSPYYRYINHLINQGAPTSGESQGPT